MEARKMSPVENPRIGALDYLKHIEGLNYGGDRDNGFVRNREFVHPKLRIRFEVPKGFNIFNGPTQVAAMGPNKAQIIFDMTPKGTGDSARAYLSQWAQSLRLSNIEAIKVNGLDAATGSARVSTKGGQMDLRLVAIRFTPKIYYRFIMVSPPSRSAARREDYERTTYSFKVLTQEEADKAQPYRIRLHLTKAGETAEQVAAQLPDDDYKLDRFLELNGLKSEKDMKPNQLVKVVND